MYRFPLHTQFRLTSRFGGRKDPFTGQWKGHNGIDLAVPINTPVYAPADGTVISSFTNSVGGNQMIIEHRGGFKTGYAHLNSKLPIGVRVKKNEIIAYTGNTGRSTGPHLHLTTKKKDKLVDPLTIAWQMSPDQDLQRASILQPTAKTAVIAGLSLAGILAGRYIYLNYIRK